MSTVSTRLSLTHLCTIERDANGGTLNAAGAVQTPDWRQHLTDLPCRGWTRSGREATNADTTAVVEDMRLIVPVGTDVNARDRISEVSYRGDTLIVGPVGIRAVIRYSNFIELVLARVSG